MTKTPRPVYRLSTGNFLLKSPGLGSWGVLLGEKRRELEEFDERDIPPYLERGLKKFLTKLKSLENPTHPMSEQDEKDLRFMLDALIYAKQTLTRNFRKRQY